MYNQPKNQQVYMGLAIGYTLVVLWNWCPCNTKLVGNPAFGEPFGKHSNVGWAVGYE